MARDPAIVPNESHRPRLVGEHPSHHDDLNISIREWTTRALVRPALVAVEHPTVVVEGVERVDAGAFGQRYGREGLAVAQPFEPLEGATYRELQPHHPVVAEEVGGALAAVPARAHHEPVLASRTGAEAETRVEIPRRVVVPRDLLHHAIPRLRREQMQDGIGARRQVACLARPCLTGGEVEGHAEDHACFEAIGASSAAGVPVIPDRPGVERPRESQSNTRARANREGAVKGCHHFSVYTSGAQARRRIESSVGRGDSSVRTSSGISLHARPTASQLRSRRARDHAVVRLP